jgi:hypothetical protein
VRHEIRFEKAVKKLQHGTSGQRFLHRRRLGVRHAANPDMPNSIVVAVEG